MVRVRTSIGRFFHLHGPPARTRTKMYSAMNSLPLLLFDPSELPATSQCPSWTLKTCY